MNKNYYEYEYMHANHDYNDSSLDSSTQQDA